MKKVFASGSCRLLTSITDGKNVIDPIHSMYQNFIGKNFLGKFHNTKQHIQFIEWIYGKKQIPEEYYKHIFTHVNRTNFPKMARGKESVPDIKREIRKDWFDCDFYMFEICSTKVYEVNGIQIQHELLKRKPSYQQGGDEIVGDLNHLIDLLPEKANVLLQCHFRPNIYKNAPKAAIRNREVIYNSLKKFSDNKPNVILWDPSQLIKKDRRCIGAEGNHWTPYGHSRNFNNIYDMIKDVNIT